MSERRLIVRLKGGLGNQMFQYAAGRALAARTGMKLALDVTSGFIRDKIYKRRFCLSVFPIQTEKAGLLGQLPFAVEQTWHKYGSVSLSPIVKRPWGTFLYETRWTYCDEVASYRPDRNTWMEGYWQSEAYFTDYRETISREFTLPAPVEPQFLSMAETIETCNSVAVGVRLFEEMPGVDKANVGGVAPFSFYEDMASRLANRMKNPTFFVFCTSAAPVQGKLKLPGPIFYVTHDNGFAGTVQNLWLISRCDHHILSNSSFYWWGAWLSERRQSGNMVIACDLFLNRDTIPPRWERYTLP